MSYGWRQQNLKHGDERARWNGRTGGKEEEGKGRIGHAFKGDEDG